MLTQREESKSFRVCSQNESGGEVFVANASYSARGIFVSFEMLDKDFCLSHIDDVQEAVSSFVGRLNALLEEAELPAIQAGETP